MAVAIRQLGPGDLDLLMAVEEGLFDNPVDPAQARAFLASPLNVMMLACDGREAVGMISGTVLLHPDKPPAMFINELGTRESHQGRQIATGLMRAMFALARARGCQGIWLATEPDNAAAMGLYRKLDGEEMALTGFAWDGAFDPG